MPEGSNIVSSQPRNPVVVPNYATTKDGVGRGGHKQPAPKNKNIEKPSMGIGNGPETKGL